MYFEEISAYIYVEYKKYRKYDCPNEVYNYLSSNNIVQNSNGYFWLKAVGFFIIGPQIIVVMPKGYILKDPEEVTTDVKQLFQVLIKYYNENDKENDEGIVSGGNIGVEEGNLYAAYSLISDYMNYGILRRDIQFERVSSSGKANWAKTVNRVAPIMSEGKPIYTEWISIISDDDDTSELLFYHKYALLKSLEVYAWLFDAESIDVEITNSYGIDIDRAVYILERELRSTFVEREERVIKWILNIITGCSQNNELLLFDTIFTTSFYYVWEGICSNILNSQYKELKAVLPQPAWVLTDKNRKQEIAHRPDILVMKDTEFYIFDAKYYDINENLPGWNDAVKQFFYYLSIKEGINNHIINSKNHAIKYKLDNIMKYYNVFVFPTYADGSWCEYVGKVIVPEIEKYGKIDAIAININKAMDCYLKNIEMGIIDDIQEIIDRA